MTVATENINESVASRTSVWQVASRLGWLTLWFVVTAFTVFEVVKHGYVNGDPIDALILTGAAVGFFVLPDLTFLIGLTEHAERGHLPSRSVPYYNALHRFWPPVIWVLFIGVAFSPLTLGTLALFVGGLSWLAHVCLDRAAGYGLRNADGSR